MSALTTTAGVRADASTRTEDLRLNAFYASVAQMNLAPAWLVYKEWFRPCPNPAARPAHWSYQQVRPSLLQSAQLISAEQAERRVLMFENPGMPGQGRITRTMSGALQLLLPKERAPAHRHSASAFRFILEAKGGALTTVDGQQTWMRPGDLVVTPSWAWHDHENPSDENVIWFDGLDVHLVNVLDVGFFEAHPKREQSVTRAAGVSCDDVAHNLLPIARTFDTRNSPICNYPYSRTREALNVVAQTSEPDPWRGFQMKYVNPLTGGWVMPTIATSIQLLPKGFHSAPYRSTEAAIYIVVEGSGSSTIGDSQFAWREHDVFVVPNWAFHEMTAETDAVLFSYSERAALESLGLFREERINR